MRLAKVNESKYGGGQASGSRVAPKAASTLLLDAEVAKEILQAERKQFNEKFNENLENNNKVLKGLQERISTLQSERNAQHPTVLFTNPLFPQFASGQQYVPPMPAPTQSQAISPPRKVSSGGGRVDGMESAIKVLAGEIGHLAASRAREEWNINPLQS